MMNLRKTNAALNGILNGRSNNSFDASGFSLDFIDNLPLPQMLPAASIRALDGYVMRTETLEQLLDDLANHPRTAKDFLAKGDWMPFLPILEFPLDEVQAKMPQLFTSKFPASPSEFSCSALVVYALKWPTSYWRELAVEWIAQGLPVNPQIADELESLVKDKHVSQKSRHKAGRLLNQWKRS